MSIEWLIKCAPGKLGYSQVTNMLSYLENRKVKRNVVAK